ncbi:MAG: exonuclease SbcC, partial [Nitrosopumilaceae archaeon]|nr:exonuclease SbcC [Nitrosopumilaceae archaeon]
MVFGWGKKKKESKVIPEAPMSSTEREVSFSDIDKILDDLKKIRSKTLISETSSFKKRIENQLKEVREIGIDLEKDDLKIDDIDKHLKTIVERGKKQVISTIKEETSHKISDVKSIDDVMSMSTQVNRSLKKIGDVLGRQSRVIHLFAKKYAGRLKAILAELQDDLETVQTLIGNYKKLEDGILEIDQNVRNINRAKESLTKKSKRVKTFEESIKEFEEKKNQINSEIEELKNSAQYNEFLQVKKQLEQLEPEKHDL